MGYQNISARDAQQWLSNGEAVFIDVREPAEFANKHIEGAKLIPLGKISAKDLPSTNKKIIIYCQKGLRGNSACAKVTKQSNEVTVYNLEGGIQSWVDAGFHTIKGESKVLPIDRQVQLTIGLLALTGSIAGHFISPAFLLIPAFLGAGLIFAGLSGTCGLAVLLAKLPWNQ